MVVLGVGSAMKYHMDIQSVNQKPDRPREIDEQRNSAMLKRKVPSQLECAIER
jgi:hypothetical protein